MNNLLPNRMQTLLLLVFGALTWLIMFAYFDAHISRLQENVDAFHHGPSSRSAHSFFADRSDIATSSLCNNNLILIYNRVPKTASTSFMRVAYDLCKLNSFHVLHVNISKNSHIMNVADQATFARNVTYWVQMKPAIYHGHFAYLDFSRISDRIVHGGFRSFMFTDIWTIHQPRLFHEYSVLNFRQSRMRRKILIRSNIERIKWFGLPNPVFINIVREPLERLVSYYYFLRYGDDFRPKLVRRKMGNTETFDECVERGGKDCDPKNLWLQIPFFCGHSVECRKPGSRWALEQAKRNLVDHYLVVGITEQLADFVKVLELTLPSFFNGATEIFQASDRIRRTQNKTPPSERSIVTIRNSLEWKMESEFYEFAKEQFEFLKRKLLSNDEDANGNNSAAFSANRQQFHYEKIKP